MKALINSFIFEKLETLPSFYFTYKSYNINISVAAVTLPQYDPKVQPSEKDKGEGHVRYNILQYSIIYLYLFTYSFINIYSII